MKALIIVRHLRNLRPITKVIEKPLQQPPEIASSKAEPGQSRNERSVNFAFTGDTKALLAKAVTPLAHLSYKDQLKTKSKKLQNIVAAVKESFKEAKASIQPNLQPGPIIPSPVISGYRNKDEFNVRYGLDGNLTCGFFIGSASQNNLLCVPPYHLSNVSATHQRVAQAFENYVRQSAWPVCEHFQKGGHWRIIQVRSNQQKEVMATVIFHPQTLTAAEIEEEMEKLKHYFQKGEGKFARVKTLYYQACPHTRCTSKQAPFHLLYGPPYVHESLNDSVFRISPESFFQVNTRAAEVLYQQVETLARIDRTSTILDICCGTGTMGILMAPKVRQVVGIDNNVSAVEDAKSNAELNGIRNIKFHTGRAELMIKQIVAELDDVLDVIAVVNPGRSGLPNVVVNVLRECEVINKVIYVSCHPEGPAQNNFVQLCRTDFRNQSKKVKGYPFKLKKVIPVDMFPHTEHCELILSFERFDIDTGISIRIRRHRGPGCLQIVWTSENVFVRLLDAPSIRHDNNKFLHKSAVFYPEFGNELLFTY